MISLLAQLEGISMHRKDFRRIPRRVRLIHEGALCWEDQAQHAIHCHGGEELAGVSARRT